MRAFLTLGQSSKRRRQRQRQLRASADCRLFVLYFVVVVAVVAVVFLDCDCQLKVSWSWAPLLESELTLTLALASTSQRSLATFLACLRQPKSKQLCLNVSWYLCFVCALQKAPTIRAATAGVWRGRDEGGGRVRGTDK